jgi:hypothetical protein
MSTKVKRRARAVAAGNRAADAERTANDAQLAYRVRLAKLFRATPLKEDDLLFNLGLYVRSGLLVKFLALHELYKRFARTPGLLVEFGTWWGQNLILLENLRAIHEPFNKQRRIVGFDTFKGYRGFDARDRIDRNAAKGFYRTTPGHRRYLADLLRVHEGINVNGHLESGHELIEGDVARTAPRYFAEHPESIVAFAYFDIGLYRPTLAAMKAIRPHLVPGSIVLLDEFTWQAAPGEALAFKEALADKRHRMEKLALYPSKTIVEFI